MQHDEEVSIHNYYLYVKEIIYNVIINRTEYLFPLLLIHVPPLLGSFLSRLQKTDFTIPTSALLYQRYSIGSHYIYMYIS